MPIPNIIPPAGISPASAFYPRVFNPLGLPAAFLADDTSNNGELVSITSGRDAVDDAVVTAIRAAYGSGTALGTTGNRFATIEKIDDTTASALKFLVEDALKTLVRNRDIEIVSVTSETQDYMGGFYLEYRNLRSGQSAKNSVRKVPLSIQDASASS